MVSQTKSIRFLFCSYPIKIVAFFPFRYCCSKSSNKFVNGQENPVCHVCGAAVSNPNVQIDVLACNIGINSLSCQQILTYGLSGMIPSTQCSVILGQSSTQQSFHPNHPPSSAAMNKKTVTMNNVIAATTTIATMMLMTTITLFGLGTFFIRIKLFI